MTDSASNIERGFLRVLVGWGVFGVISGAAMMAPGWGRESPPSWQVFWSACGSQFFIWGAIDAVLAGFGLRSIGRRLAGPAEPPEAEAVRVQKSLGFLRLNGRLDVLYVLVGVALLIWAVFATTPAGRASLLGHGIGVLIQGGFLLVFDRQFAGRLGEAPRHLSALATGSSVRPEN